MPRWPKKDTQDQWKTISTTSPNLVFDFRDPWGNRHRLTFEDEMTARAYAEMQSNAALAHRFTHRAKFHKSSLEAAAKLYLYVAPIAASTKKTQAQYLKLLSRHFPARTIDSISPLELQHYVAMRHQELSPISYQNQADLLKRFFAWAKNSYLIALNPAEKIFVRHVHNTAGRVLTYAEEYKFLHLIHGTHAAQFLLARDAGLRFSNVSKLQSRNFDLKERTLSFTATKFLRPRVLPLTERLFTSLAPLVPPDPYRLVFQSHVHCRHPRQERPGISHARGCGNPIQSSASFTWNTKEKTGLFFRFHDLRHTFFNRLLEASKDDRLTRWTVGHDVRDAADIYFHPSIERLREAFAEMEHRTVNAFAEFALSEYEKEV
jgi:integrase